MMISSELLAPPAAMALAIWFGVIGAGAAENLAADSAASAVKHANAEQAHKLMADPHVVVLDLRTPEEFKAGRIAGATNLDFHASDFDQQLASLDKGKTYLVHCASGNRSTRALPLFKKLQFQSLYHLDGGLKGWQKAGLSVEK